MNNLIELHLERIEELFVSANTKNFEGVADKVEPILQLVLLECRSHPEMHHELRRCEDLAIALCSRLSDLEPDEIEIDALRSDALEQLARIRHMIENWTARVVRVAHGEANIENDKGT